MKLVFALVNKTLQHAINLAIKTNPQLQTSVAELAAKSLSIHITDWQLSATIIPTTTELLLQLNGNGKASVEIHGKLADLMALGMSEQPQSVLIERHIEVNGSLQVLMQYQKAFKQLQFDWEVWLSRLVGPTIAHQVCRPVKASGNWLKATAHSTHLDVIEYLQEEAQLLPPKEAVADFYEDIVTLQNRLDRLAQRIEAAHH